MKIKPLKIKPLKGLVYIKNDVATAGDLITASRDSKVEFAEVLAVGEGVEGIKKGDKIFVKGWATDNISHNDITYKFVAVDTNGILAIVK